MFVSSAVFTTNDPPIVHVIILSIPIQLLLEHMSAAELVELMGDITDKGIFYMENKTVDTIKEWLSFGTQLIP